MKPSELIEKYGWIQGRLGNEEIGYCVVGAISFGMPTNKNVSFFDIVFDLLAKKGISYLAPWNDLPTTTKEDVLTLLKQAESIYYDNPGEVAVLSK